MAAIVPRPGGDASSDVRMRAADRFQLHHGPYTPPARNPGDPAVCRYRDAGVIVTSWSDAPIPWPRCQAPGQRGGSGLLVDAELARAVRCESAQAVRYWWGASRGAVYSWRKALGVERFKEGSKRLHDAAAVETGRRTRGRKLPPEEVERRRRTAGDLDLGQHLWNGFDPVKRWTAAELARLGTLSDEQLAGQLGRRATAVRVQRPRLGIASACDRRRRENRG
jgi:hypothetical protein